MKNKSEVVCGIDLSKSVFQIHAVDARGNVNRKKIGRAAMREYFEKASISKISMEACGGAHYWGRTLKKMGHEVSLIPPQYVKPFVKTNKNDSADAEAIVEASMRPGMRFVAIKETWQQDILLVHRVRERLVRSRTSLMNEIRGLLHEYGIVFPQGASQLQKGLLEILGREDLTLSGRVRNIMYELYEEWMNLEKRINKFDLLIKEIFRGNEVCKRLATIPGVGEQTATAIVASMGDPHAYKNGRHFAASLGLVPRQNSSGGKTKLLGISKRGDKYIRKLLVHGARSVVRHIGKKEDRYSCWLKKKVESRGFNKATVAAANKNARICWAIMMHGTSYISNN